MTDSAWQRALQESYSQGGDNEVAAATVKNSRSAKVQYWRKQNGFITTGPTISNAPKYQQMLEIKRARALPERFGSEYLGGKYLQPTDPRLGRQSGPDGKIVPGWLIPFFNAGGHKYILTERDYSFGAPGEYLMPREQILQLNLHRLDWMKQDRPDVADVEDIPCPYHCRALGAEGPRLFTCDEDLSQHIVATHREAVASKAMGDAIIAAQNAATAQQGSSDYKTIAIAVAAALKSMGIGDAKSIDQLTTETKPFPDGPPDDTWKRKELMAYAGHHNMFPGKEANPFKWTAAEWVEYLLRNHEFEGTEPSPEPDYGVSDMAEQLEGADN